MTYDAQDLKQYMILSQKGDQDSYRSFLIEVVPLIESRVRRQLINKDDVSDVVQEVLISIHKSLATYDSKRDVLPWLMTITHRRIVDYIRKITRINDKEVLTSDGDVTYFEDHTKSSVVDLSYFRKLSEETRSAIKLTKIEGYSTKEAAQMLGLKENALRTKISRGMSKLRDEAKRGTLDE
jgi:RNA polymerase sigma-70 factor (ECF subfamily)